MPCKGSRAIHKKNSVLGHFQRDKKLLNNMEIKINELEKVLKDKQLRFDQKIKFDHKKSILDDLQSATDNTLAKIRKEKRKSVFSISACLGPSSESTPSHSKTIRRKETMTVCMKIHGGTVLKKEPVLHGMLDTLTSQFKTKTLTKKILNTKDYLTNNIKKMC